jgi:hypothetical protein
VCGALFLDIRFSDGEMARLYHGYRDAMYVQQRERFEPGYAERNRSFESGSSYIGLVEELLISHLPNQHPKVLDWGGDTGINTLFRQSASVLHVYDISAVPVVHGARSVTRREFLPDYDLIVLSQVLEHVPNPEAIIRDIVPVMHKDSILYIEVPYEDLMRGTPPDGMTSHDLYRAKRHWHEHVNFFAHAALHALVTRCGLETAELTTMSVTTAGRSCHISCLVCKLAHASFSGKPHDVDFQT